MMKEKANKGEGMINPLKNPAIVAKLCHSNVEDVKKVLPAIISALEEQKILTYYSLVAALATAGVESHFACVEEAWYLSEAKRNAYFNKSKYGKVDAETGKRYYGRGIIQLTWKKHYEDYGDALGIDLFHHPEKALEPETAAKILALYFKWTKVNIAAQQQDWNRTRKLVNGGFNGLTVYMQYVNACLKALKDAKCI